jgi:hypothetical protein
MPAFVDWPIKCRDDFERIKEQYQPDIAARYPDDYEEKLSFWNNSCPNSVAYEFRGMLFHRLRMWLGPKGAPHKRFLTSFFTAGRDRPVMSSGTAILRHANMTEIANDFTQITIGANANQDIMRTEQSRRISRGNQTSFRGNDFSSQHKGELPMK